MAVVSGQSTGTIEVTPSGIQVYFQSQPKRLYKIREWVQADADGTPYEDESWREVPSVSSVLDILEGPPVWWGQQIGVDGVCDLVRRGALIVVNE